MLTIISLTPGETAFYRLRKDLRISIAAGNDFSGEAYRLG
jgi:hypothetical protein